MSNRFLVSTLALSITLAGSLGFAAETKSSAKKAEPAKAEAAAKAPKLTIVEPVKNFGTVAKGDKIDWAFLVKNTGDADLTIASARPSCGCTVADFDKVIKPGETGKVTAHVDTTNFAGPIAKAITLETNDPQLPSAQLTLNAVVKPYVEAVPAGFVRYSLLQGDSGTEYVKLYSEETEPFEIVKVESPESWIKVDTKKIEKMEDRVPQGPVTQNQYGVAITVGGPEAKLGPIAEKVHIVTNSKHQPDFFISVSGVVRPRFRVEPMDVNFGELAPSDPAAKRSIILHSNDVKAPASFAVTKVESSSPVIGAAFKPTGTAGEYEVTLDIAKDAKAGDVDGNVKIYTNDTVNPIITVPYKATVKTASAPAAAPATK